MITLEEANKDQNSLFNEINRFNSSKKKEKTKMIPLKI